MKFLLVLIFITSIHAEDIIIIDMSFEKKFTKVVAENSSVHIQTQDESIILSDASKEEFENAKSVEKEGLSYRKEKLYAVNDKYGNKVFVRHHLENNGDKFEIFYTYENDLVLGTVIINRDHMIYDMVQTNNGFLILDMELINEMGPTRYKKFKPGSLLNERYF